MKTKEEKREANRRKQKAYVKKWGNTEKYRQKRRVINLKAQRTYQEKWGTVNRNYRLMVVSLLREKNGESCGICQGYLGDAIVEIDHIVPINKGGTASYSNLQLSHRDCNRKKHYQNL